MCIVYILSFQNEKKCTELFVNNYYIFIYDCWNEIYFMQNKYIYLICIAFHLNIIYYIIKLFLSIFRLL